MSNKITKNELHSDIVQTLDKVQVATNDIATLSTNISTHKADETSNVYYADDTGIANAKVVSINPVPTSYKKGLGVSFTNLVQNTGAVTINVNGLGAKAVLKSNGSALTSGNLKANSIYTVRYNGTSFILQGEGGEYGTAEAPQVLSGYTVGRESGIVSGSMINRGAPTLLISSFNETSISQGYYSGGNVKLTVVAGDTAIYDGSSYTYRDSTSWGKIKEVRIDTAGTYRITFDVSHNNTSLAYYNPAGQIYKNDSPYGSLHAPSMRGSGDGYSPGYSAYTQDLYFEAGARCALWLKAPTSGINCSTNQFKIAAGTVPSIVKIL